MVAEAIALGALAFTGVAEWLHARRVRRVAALAFGPGRRARWWTHAAPFLRPLAVGLLTWGFITLMRLPGKVFKTEMVEEKDPRHIVLVLDVSPSMLLKDAGVEGKVSRRKRVSELLESLFKRVHTGKIVWSVVAVHNGAKPVVVDTRDLEVIRNILDDLPLHHAFDVGKTKLMDGLKEAAEVAREWPLASTTVMLFTDGDTVPATGMPTMPPSVNEFIAIGVGDSRVGQFIDGHMSRQDASTLNQIANRLRGAYHDGNRKHIDTETLRRLTSMKLEDPLEDLSRREIALAAVGSGAVILALLPVVLAWWGTGWRPGTRERARPDRLREVTHA